MRTHLEDSGRLPRQENSCVEYASLAAAVEQAADSFVMTDLDGKILYVNPAFTAMTGYASEEAVGQNPRVLKSGRHPAAFYKQLWDTIRSGQVWQGVVINRRKDGTIYDEEMQIAPVRDANGAAIGYVAVKRDITERRRAEQALRDSEQYFRSMADSCPSMLWVTGPAGEAEFLNRAYREFSGLTLEEARGNQWRSLIHPDDAPRYLAKFDSAMREHTSFSAEGRVRRADGEWRLVGSRGEPRYSPAGEYLGHIGLRADITERTKAEQQQQFQHSLIRAIYEGSLDGILVVNTDDTIVSHNKKFLDVWKLSHPSDAEGLPESIAGTSYQALLSRALERVKDPDAFMERVRALQNSKDLADRIEVELKDGRTLERYSSCIRSESGQHLGRARFYRDTTERKQAEQALRESEDRFRTMADGCPMPMWVTGADGKIMFINRALRDFTGAGPEQVEGDNWQLHCHPDDARAFIEESSLVAREHSPLKTEARFRRADGEWRWLVAIGEPRFSPRGEFLGHVGLGMDITDRKQAEQALQSSEEKFRELAENIRQVFWLKDVGSDGFLYVSPAYEQVWGRSCASVYQDPNSRLEAIHRDDLEQSRLAFARQMQGEDVETEYRIRTPEDREKWIRGRSFPIRDQDGRLIRVAGIAEEITEQKRHEEALIRAQADAEAANRKLAAQHAILDDERKLLRTFIDNVPDLMFVMDSESRFVVANPELARWAGVEKPEDLVGKSEIDVFSPEVARRMYEDDQRVIRSGKPMFNREEIVEVSSDKGFLILLTTKVPLFDSEGHVTGIAGMARDITERKVIEDALRESNRELQKSIDRANKLAWEADAANRSKSEFLANMSHEIRTPMNGVIGMNGLLLSSNLEGEQRHYAEVIDVSAKSLLTVIDDILDYSKVEAGKLEIDTVDFNLHVLMGDFAELMAERVGDRQLEFVCAVAPNVSSNLTGDPGRLRQVLQNLAGNAMKFTQQGEVVVRAELISETDDRVCLRFTVRDTGIGIPLDKQRMLFNSFTQVDASTTRQYGGTGLGLAISKKLVELMGGEIGIESKEGEGSNFWFTICVAKQKSNPQVNTPRVPVKGSRILVVDDNATNREVLTAQLHSWGAAVVAVESGPTALACLRYAVATGTPFQLAVLDMAMPGMDGATLGRAILGDEDLKSIPLVMMTSLGQRGDAHRFREIGFAAYLTKPVRQSDLFDCLSSLLTGGQQTETRPLITRHSLQAARRSNARILLAEDNHTNQEVACGMLQRMGWHADVAQDGKEALQALERTSYDLVLMDVQMPEMDGYEATRLIRDPNSAVLNHNVPIIATTAHAMAGDAAKCLAAGMSDYVSKPIDPKILEQLVEKWLIRKEHGAPGAMPAESAGDTKAPAPVAALVFNREVFLERMMGDEEFAHEVAAEFVKELPTLIGALEDWVREASLESIWKEAHKIKGSAANVGGEALRDIALKVEQAGKAGNSAEVFQWIPELEIQATRLIEALQRWQVDLGLPKHGSPVERSN